MKRLLAGLAVLALGLAVYRWWPTDARRIASRWEHAQELIEKRGPESQVEAAARIAGLTRLFGPGFAVFAAPYQGTITDMQELRAIVAGYRQGASQIEVSDSDREIVVRPENETADLTAIVEVNGVRGGTLGRERFRVRVAWREDAGKWWIQELEILEVLDPGLLF